MEFKRNTQGLTTLSSFFLHRYLETVETRAHEVQELRQQAEEEERRLKDLKRRKEDEEEELLVVKKKVDAKQLQLANINLEESTLWMKLKTLKEEVEDMKVRNSTRNHSHTLKEEVEDM